MMDNLHEVASTGNIIGSATVSNKLYNYICFLLSNIRIRLIGNQ